jgi:ribonuclease BN (tRNA processing enzyme)
MSASHIEDAFHLREYDPGGSLAIGPLTLRFRAVPHFMATHAVEVVSSVSGGRLTYGADSSPSDDLVEFALESDLLLIEATLPRPEREGPRGHLTPAEAGQHGQRARAKRLVLTHISDELDPGWARAEASHTYDGEVVVASDGAVFEL